MLILLFVPLQKIRNMGLQCGITGLSNVGKTTLFNCLSRAKAESSKAAFSATKSNVGVFDVPDNRLAELEKFQKTDRLVAATVELVDIPGLTKGGSKAEGGNRFLGDIRNTDALIHVLRCFDDDSLPHTEGSVDPVRDMEILDFELQLKDLESVEKKLHRTEKMAKAGEKDAKITLDVLRKYKLHLENMKNAREIDISEEEKKHVADLFLLTSKPVIYVCNVDDASAVKGNRYVEAVREALDGKDTRILVIAAEIESEIATLEPEDRQMFLEELGLEEPGVNKLVRAAYDLLKLRTFFTVGPKEIRAWTIHSGMFAPQAAGVIHSDLERGFIRAEVMKYKDFTTLGSEQACKEKGKFYVEGKKYVVEDGDIMHIRFNV